jgi:hypothetical protein
VAGTLIDPFTGLPFDTTGDGGTSGGGGQNVNVNDNPVFNFSDFFGTSVGGGGSGLITGLLIGAGVLILVLLVRKGKR